MEKEIRDLEDAILAMEQQFTQNQVVDVSLLIEKTKKLQELQVNLAREEGLRAGLTIQEVKKQRNQEANRQEQQQQMPFPPQNTGFPPNHPQNHLNSREFYQNQRDQAPFSPVNQPPLYQNMPPMEQVPAYQESGQIPYYPITPKRRDPFLRRKPEESDGETRKSVDLMEKYTELNLGKYVMAILASILALAGTVILGTLVWDQISNEMKAIAFGLVATLMIFFPFRHIMAKEVRQSNGFLTSLMGAGLSIHYINCIFMGTNWGILSDITLLGALLLLIFLTVFLSHQIRSNTLLTVSFIGNYTTYFLLVFKEIPLNNLYIAMIFLLASTLFLMAYTMKNDWTYTLTKVFSGLLGLAVMLRGVDALEYADRIFRISLDLDAEFIRYFQTQSPLFALYLVIVLFAVLFGLALGYAVSRVEEGEEEVKYTSFAIFALAIAYFVFATAFYRGGWAVMLTVLSTFVLNREKSTPSMVSMPFIAFAMVDITDYLASFLHFQSQSQGQELIFFYSMVIIGLVLFFFSRNSFSKRYKVAVISYTFVAWVFFQGQYSQIWEALPLLLLLMVQMIQGYEDCDEEQTLSMVHLGMYIPVSMVISKCFWTFSGERDDYFSYVVCFLVYGSGMVSIGKRYLEKLDYQVNFLKLVQATKIVGYVCVCLNLIDGRQEMSLMLLQSVAVLAVMAELSFILIGSSLERTIAHQKIFALLGCLFGIISWTESTALGDFAMTSSILILLSGCVSIFLGFRQMETELRHFGLALCILGVLKLVTVDVASTDSIIRVVALIVGAVLCFLISCVYNKIDPTGGEIPSPMDMGGSGAEED